MDTENIVTPVKVDVLSDYLKQTKYDPELSKFLIEGFSQGFDLGYRGPSDVQMQSKNLKFTIGNHLEMWNKIMKEVQCKRYAGPFKNIPFKYYIQSPLGLVPKDNGTKTRLIFHLSYPRDENTSVNSNTPKEFTSVQYPDFAEAVRLCMQWGEQICYAAKSDLTSAFRHICINKKYWFVLVMKAKSPIDGKTYYFFDKCLPFGAAISCAIFQAFSNALAHIVRYYTEAENLNYLDDFFFVALLKAVCDRQVKQFLQICEDICFPVSLAKTFFARKLITFLGLLINTERRIVCIPIDKVLKARDLILQMLGKQKIRKSTTVREMQQLTGFLNFLCKAIVPGRVFTRRLYAQTGNHLKPHHHISLTHEIKEDLKMWLIFLNHETAFARPFADFKLDNDSQELDWYTDASTTLGCGGYFGSNWFIAEWDLDTIKLKPSINYLELYAVAVSVLNWLPLVANKRVTLFCDNMSVVQMVNSTSSSCKNCMVLL